MFKKSRIIIAITVILLIFTAYFYFKYYFTEEQKNITQRKIESITGQNLVVTVFGFDGRVIKRWTGVKKLHRSRMNGTILFSIRRMGNMYRFLIQSGI